MLKDGAMLFLCSLLQARLDFAGGQSRCKDAGPVIDTDAGAIATQSAKARMTPQRNWPNLRAFDTLNRAPVAARG